MATATVATLAYLTCIVIGRTVAPVVDVISGAATSPEEVAPFRRQGAILTVDPSLAVAANPGAAQLTAPHPAAPMMAPHPAPMSAHDMLFPWKHGHQTTRKPDFGILTQDPQIAGYILLMNGIVWAIIILFIWLPSFILLFFQIGVQWRSSDGRSNTGSIGSDMASIWEWDESSIGSRMTLLRDIWDKFDSSDPACRQRVVCEVHRYQSHIGTLPRLILTTLDDAVDMGLSVVPEYSNKLLRQYCEAKGTGDWERNDCRKYNSCPYSIVRYMKYPKESYETADQNV